MIDEITLKKAQEDTELMSKMLAESERRFNDFNAIVLYVNNSDDVYSPRLVDLLQSIGAQIDGMLKILLSIADLEPQNDSFPSICKELNKDGMLGMRELMLIESGRVVQPFQFDSNYTTSWRSAYNDVKHELPSGAYSGKYGNVINALAALTILHAITRFALQSRGLRPDILQGKNWSSLIDFWELRSLSEDKRREKLAPDFWRETAGFSSELFYNPILWTPK